MFFSFYVHWGFFVCFWWTKVMFFRKHKPENKAWLTLQIDWIWSKGIVLKTEYNRIYNGKLLHVRERLSKRTSVATGHVLLGINGILQGPCSSVAWRFLRVLLGKPYIPLQGFSTALLCHCLYKHCILPPHNHPWYQLEEASECRTCSHHYGWKPSPLSREIEKPPVPVEIHLSKGGVG